MINKIVNFFKNLFAKNRDSKDNISNVNKPLAA